MFTHNALYSDLILLPAVPCVPSNISVEMDCTNSTALVSWAASLGAVQYAVMAHSNNSNVSCQTSGLSCHLDNLTCGNLYRVQVVAMDDNCSSVPSQAVLFNTGKTPPTHTRLYTSVLLNLFNSLAE